MLKIRMQHNFAAVMSGLDADIKRAATKTADALAVGIKQDLRDQVLSAGFGARLANSWRGQRFPGHDSLNAAAFVWSRAPDIIDSFDRGATIRPVNGRRYLAIPTENCPPRQRGSGGKGSKMSPADVENTYNQDLKFFKGANGRLFAYVNVVGAQNKRGFRAATPKRIAGGRQVASVVMFVMIPTVRMPKKFDLDSIANKWAGRVQSILTDNLT